MVPLPGPAAASPRLLLLPAATATAAASSSSLSVPQAAAASSPPRKRQRLAHLSPEEKALRRKLKNRVAAQSARDRKKARMGELERQAVELEVENQKLLAENQLLREQTHALALENQELRLRLGLPALESQALTQEAPTLVVKVEVPEFLETEEEEEEEGSLSPRSPTGSAKSAALRLRVPLQQGQAQQSPASRAQVNPSTWIWTHLTLQMLSLISSWAFWTAWTQRCSWPTPAWTQPAWINCSHSSTIRGRRRRLGEKRIPYQPPPVPLWGPRHPSWKPLMN